ncbi:MAG: heavy-metal-associated domain-containing protein [Acidobacteria bacterium]|nr:heavy-metal-associated domain-containing protein [Acidobacteriota bacterium]
MNITNRLWLRLVWAGLIVLPLGNGLPVGASPTPQSVEQTTAKQKTVQFRIAGMTCAACAKGLEASFRNLAGVMKADVDYKAGQALITFDAAKQSAERLSKFVVSCGYQVKETKVV